MGAEFTLGSRKQICVVVDTSVWRAEPLLKTPLGVTLVYSVSRRGGLIGLPEVVELELKNQILEAGLGFVDKANDASQMLRILADDPFFGTHPPTAETLNKKVDERLNQLSRIFVREPFTLDHAKAALEMVNAKLPPNGEKNQQFKDSAIWQAVLALSKRFCAVLLTNEKGFFVDRMPEKGLARNLIADCNTAGTQVNCFYGIGPYLEALKAEEPVFDRDRAQQLIIAVAMPRLKSEAERLKAESTYLLGASISAFPTEDPDRLAIDYTLTYKLDPVSPAFRTRDDEQYGVIHGSGYFLPAENNLVDHYVQRIAMKSHGSLSARSFKDYDGSFAFPRPLPWD
jgi:hypothetical protein